MSEQANITARIDLLKAETEALHETVKTLADRLEIVLVATSDEVATASPDEPPRSTIGTWILSITKDLTSARAGLISILDRLDI